MLTVFYCITIDHDLRLVLLAGLICMFASFSAINLLVHAGRGGAWTKLLWILGAGTVAGCGIWATHFIAMLAFRPDEPLSYDPGTTILSFGVAIVFSTIGFAVAARFQPAGIGGAIVGLSIGAMHYIGRMRHTPLSEKTACVAAAANTVPSTIEAATKSRFQTK